MYAVVPLMKIKMEDYERGVQRDLSSINNMKMILLGQKDDTFRPVVQDSSERCMFLNKLVYTEWHSLPGKKTLTKTVSE